VVQRHFGLLIGQSDSFLQIINTIPRLTMSDATVLISGETGTGKDLVARAIHYHGARKTKPFIPVNCAALPHHLVENELFGHARGAFTDASSTEKGLLAEAEGGTLFLDEINALSGAAQGKLLRLLENKEYRPLGSTTFKTANVRILAATNRELRQEVENGRFRQDLYYRLNTLCLEIPALRERPEDISLLARCFLDEYAGQYKRGALYFSACAIGKMEGYDWPGNVRELQGMIHRAVLLSSLQVLTSEEIDLPKRTHKVRFESGNFREIKALTIEQFERSYLEDLLTAHHGNVSHAARHAGKERRSFQRLLQKYGLIGSGFRKVI
jgi:two-component system response regulator GlrR